MKVAKRLFFDMGGNLGRVNAMPGATFDPGGIKKTMITADNVVVGSSDELVPATMQFKVPNTKGMLAALKKMGEINVNVQDDNGDSWIVREAVITDVPKLSGGEIDVSMSGQPAEDF